MGRTPGNPGKRPARTFARKIPLRVRCTGRFDAPADKAQKRPFLGRFDAERPETHRSVFGPRKREKRHMQIIDRESRGTPITNRGRNVGVQTPGPPSW